MTQVLRLAALSGIASFIFFWLPSVPGFEHNQVSSAAGVALNVLAIVLYVLYMYGLSLVGKKYHSRLFRVTAWLFLALNLVSLLAALTTFYTPLIELFWMSITAGAGGILEILIGYAALRLIPKLGIYGGVYGAVAIAAGLSNFVGYAVVGFDGVFVDAIESALFLLGAAVMWKSTK